MIGYGLLCAMSTTLHEQGYNLAWIETQIAHADKNSIRGTYTHAKCLDGRREMRTIWITWSVMGMWCMESLGVALRVMWIF
ncbi:hypothetical protein A9Q62_14530 [Yersinia ruckeri]|nr:hypothetical protein A9Q62_14530 [Yersinia ruckeri]OJB91153.1 hypothetical protein A9Q60_14160 [Yersinia ruckeri]